MAQNKKRIAAIVILLLATNILTFFGTSYYFQAANGIGKFLSIKNALYKYYNGNIDEKALNENAIKGMVNSLGDPYTVFMDSKEYEQFNTLTHGNYAGIGIQVESKDNKIIVMSVFDNSPAKQSGVLSGDIITDVNGEAISGNEIDKAVGLIKGPEGTTVKVGFFRKDKGDFELTIDRKKIELSTISGEMIDSRVGYIQVSMFDENTDKNFKQKLDELKGKGMKGLIIDLRGNPGGILTVCQDMLSNFIEKDKTLVYMVDKYNQKEVFASKGGDYQDLPIVVLVDGGSASASEIFSGAVKDYSRAELIGTKTFGKGVVQSILDTGDGTALKVTISKYYTPNGNDINHQGIVPDIEVNYPDNLKDKPYNRSLDPQFDRALQTVNQKIK